MSLAARLELLRTILEKKKNKEDVSEADLEAAGLTSKSRIKDIEKEIKAIRIQVSKGIKDGVKEEEEREIEEEAKEQSMTVEEYKEKLQEEAHNQRQKELFKNAKLESGASVKEAVAQERRKKNQARVGEFDDY